LVWQRFLNLTVEKIEQVHADGIAFMQAAKELFPYRNGSRNQDGSHIGWNVWKLHSILHKSMDLLLYGWSENMSTQSGESAHNVNCFVLIMNHYYMLLHTFTHCYTILYITFRHLSSTTFVFQTNIKDVQRCTNHKAKLLCLVRQHMRRQVIERLERSTVCEDRHEDDIFTINGEISFSNSACDLGIRYPIFQASVGNIYICV
jgi:hypothetical protein